MWAGKRARRFNKAEKDALKNSVKTALHTKDGCKKYIEDLIKKAAEITGAEVKETDILKLLEDVFSSRGDNPSNGGIWEITLTTSTSAGCQYC